MTTTDGADLHLRYRLRPTERVIYTLLFQPLARSGVVIGILACVVGVAIGGILGAALIGGGAAAATSFAWSPFVTRRKAPLTEIIVSDEGITFDIAGTSATMASSTVRRVRRSAGALAIDFAPKGTLPIPMRALNTSAVRRIEALANPDAARPGTTTEPRADEVVGEVRIRATLHARMLDGISMQARRPAVLAAMALGLAFIAWVVIDRTGGQTMEASTALVAGVIGVVLVTLPLWAFPFGVRVSGGAAALLGLMPVEIGDGGYRVRTPAGEVAMPWTSFKAARRTGAFMRFVVRANGNTMLFATRGLTADQSAELDAILRRAGLDPG